MGAALTPPAVHKPLELHTCCETRSVLQLWLYCMKRAAAWCMVAM